MPQGKHLLVMVLVTLATITVVARVTAVKTLVGFQAGS